MSVCLGSMARLFGLISSVTLLAGQIRSQDQIPNAGFENWASGSPVGWVTNGGSTVPPTVVRSTVSHTGLSAVQGQVIHLFRSGALAPEILSRFPVSTHDVALAGWYKFSPISGDVLEVDLLMFAGTTRVGSGTLIVTQAETTYTQFIMPIIYQPGTAAPDSCEIIMVINGSVPSSPVHVGSLTLLDDLAFLVNLPAPFQLSSFTATATSSGTVDLQWTTSSEFMNYGFEIQKRAQQDTGFQTIPGSLVPGHGTTTIPQHYSYVDVSPGASSLFYRLKQISVDGVATYSDPVQVTLLTSAPQQDAPVEFSLAQNYPNPFNPATVIRYALARQSDVRLEVFNMLGQRVAVLVDQKQEAGVHEAAFNGGSLSSGAYIYTIAAGQFRATKKLLLLR